MGMMFHRYAERRREKEKQILEERAKKTEKKVSKPEVKPIEKEVPKVEPKVVETPIRGLGDFQREPKRRGRKAKS